MYGDVTVVQNEQCCVGFRAGLNSLLLVERGSVLVYRNPRLCMYNVFWRSIVPGLPLNYDPYTPALPQKDSQGAAPAAGGGLAVGEQRVEVMMNAHQPMCFQWDTCDTKICPMAPTWPVDGHCFSSRACQHCMQYACAQ